MSDFVDIAVGLLVRHEGFRAFPYLDSLGIESVGLGRNLRDKGVTLEEAYYLFKTDVTAALAILRSKGITREQALYLAKNDIAQALALLSKFFWFGALSDNRKAALIDMTFDLQKRILGFHTMIGAFASGDKASAETELKALEAANPGLAGLTLDDFSDWTAFEQGNFKLAADSIRNSLFARQTGIRGKEDADLVEKG